MATIGRQVRQSRTMRGTPCRSLSIAPAHSRSTRSSRKIFRGVFVPARCDAARDLYPQREFARAIEEALASGASALGYTASQGDPLLRTTLADMLRERGISAGPDEIIVTSGVTQGMSLIAHTLARPGDCVI